MILSDVPSTSQPIFRRFARMLSSVVFLGLLNVAVECFCFVCWKFFVQISTHRPIIMMKVYGVNFWSNHNFMLFNSSFLQIILHNTNTWKASLNKPIINLLIFQVIFFRKLFHTRTMNAFNAPLIHIPIYLARCFSLHFTVLLQQYVIYTDYEVPYYAVSWIFSFMTAYIFRSEYFLWHLQKRNSLRQLTSGPELRDNIMFVTWPFISENDTLSLTPTWIPSKDGSNIFFRNVGNFLQDNFRGIKTSHFI